MRISVIYIACLISLAYCAKLPRKINPGSYLIVNQNSLLNRKGTYYNSLTKDGGYEFRTEQDNGSIRFERGSYQIIDGQKVLVQQGFFMIQQANDYWFIESYVADPINGNRVILSKYSSRKPEFDQDLFVDLISNVIPIPPVKKSVNN
ncbi:hypothetical protein ACFFRR_001822 [Megaselia abdita]